MTPSGEAKPDRPWQSKNATRVEIIRSAPEFPGQATGKHPLSALPAPGYGRAIVLDQLQPRIALLTIDAATALPSWTAGRIGGSGAKAFTTRPSSQG